MNEHIKQLLNNERLGVLAVELLDNSPHAAVMHFAYVEEPFQILLLTSKKYKKSEGILQNGTARASFVVGVSEETMTTMQIDGSVEIVTDENLRAAYLAKFPEKKEKLEGSEDILLSLKPTWWKYVNFKDQNAPIIITS